jgi:general secretion pathway protein C
MKKILKYINTIFPFLIIILLCKAFSIVLLLNLPDASIEKNIVSTMGIKFRNYQLDKAVGDVRKNIKFRKIKQTLYNLKDLTLKAIYKNKTAGIIMVSDIKTEQTNILTIGESIKGYKLSKIFPKYVIFKKNKAKYTLKLYEDSKLQDYKKTKKQNRTNGLIIYKKQILKYTTNFNSIWKNISISEVKKNKNIFGFKITFIKRGTPFEKLGIKIGDIVTKVNSVPLTSYAQGLKIYNNMNSYDYLEITILRDGKEKDLDYEIH